MANKRISRSRKRELEQPDEFVTFTGKLLEYISLHKQKIIVVSGVLLALCLGIAGTRYYSVYTEGKALSLLEKALSEYQSEKGTIDSKEVYLNVKADFALVVDEYSSTKAAKIAAVTLADISYEAGEFDTAIALYEKTLKKSKENLFYRNIISTSLAYAYEGKKEFQKAIKCLERTEPEINSELKGEVLFNLARLYHQTGQSGKEIECYQKIDKECENSIYSRLAKEKLASA